MKFTVNESAQNRRIVYWYEDNFLETEECFKLKTGSLEKIRRYTFSCVYEKSSLKSVIRYIISCKFLPKTYIGYAI